MYFWVNIISGPENWQLTNSSKHKLTRFIELNFHTAPLSVIYIHIWKKSIIKKSNETKSNETCSKQIPVSVRY